MIDSYKEQEKKPEISDIEHQYQKELDTLLNQYDCGQLSISELAWKHMKLAKQVCMKHECDLERYKQLKWKGWEKIKFRYNRDQDKITQGEQKMFTLAGYAYITEHDIV
jgi:membrane protease subunit (stomatin/prohibitin family)